MLWVLIYRNGRGGASYRPTEAKFLLILHEPSITIYHSLWLYLPLLDYILFSKEENKQNFGFSDGWTTTVMPLACGKISHCSGKLHHLSVCSKWRRLNFWKDVEISWQERRGDTMEAKCLNCWKDVEISAWIPWKNSLSPRSVGSLWNCEMSQMQHFADWEKLSETGSKG